MSKLVDKERLAKLAKALDERAKAAVAAEKERAMSVEAQLRTDVDAKVAKTDYNAKVAALVAEDERIAGLVATEKQNRENADNALSERLEAVEGIVGDGSSGSLGTVVQQVNANKAAIETLNGDANKAGSVAKAVADAKKAIEDAQKEINDDIEGRMDTVEASVAAQPAKDQAQDAKIQALEAKFTGDNSVEKQIAAAQAKAIEEAEKKDAADRTAQGLVDAEQDRRLGVLEAKFTGDNSVDDKIAAAQAAAEAKAAELDKTDRDAQALVDKAQDDRLTTLETFKEAHTHQAMEADIAANKAKLAGLEKATVKAEIEAAQAAAEKHADDAITALVDSAPEAMNTLKELAEAINSNQGIYDAYVAEHATAMANMKKELQDEIDTDVKAEADRAKGEEAKIRQEMATEAQRVDKKIADDIAAESTLRQAAEAKIVTDYKAADTALHTTISAEIDADVKVEKERAEGKEAELLAAINKEVSDRAAAVSGVQGEVDAVEKALADEKDATKAGSLAKKIADEVARATAEEADIRTAFAAADATLQGNINKKVDQTAYDTKVKALEDAIQDNADAIAQEVEDRAAAITTALGAYSTTAEMKQVIGNVVNSLALTMENDQVVLKLGGVDGIALTSVDLDLATDADIDAIIAGLDA